MRLLIINGPNINMLGFRDTNIYGKETYKDLVKKIKKYASTKQIKVKCYQSNHEGKIIDFIQKNANKYDGLIVNLGAYTHYSYAIMDSFEVVKKPVVEVHISNINEREEFRKTSLIKDCAKIQIIGKGTNGYLEAIDYLLKGGE